MVVGMKHAHNKYKVWNAAQACVTIYCIILPRTLCLAKKTPGQLVISRGVLPTILMYVWYFFCRVLFSLSNLEFDSFNFHKMKFIFCFRLHIHDQLVVW